MDVPWLRTPGEALLWTAVAAWLLVTAGALRTYTGRGSRPGPEPGPASETEVTSTEQR